MKHAAERDRRLAMNVVVALAAVVRVRDYRGVVRFAAAAAWIEKPDYRFQQDARTYDESLIGRKRL